ncbi:NADPH-dependent FMN reductase [Aquiflexum sp.]|uniref:NADPH-dependent FMN reductase n=1 Tax=Aquiflexum sp. TaxID=1872584 RepID=UPI0035940743
MTKILIISGSPRKKTVSLRLAKHIFATLKKRDEIEVDLLDVREFGLPSIQVVWQKKEDVPSEYLPLFQKMKSAEGFILVSPEYNGGYSSDLKNLLDHFPKSIYKKKAFGIVTGSLGSLGGMRAAQKLLLLVPALFGIASPFMMITPQMDKKFDGDGNLSDESFSDNIDIFISEYLWLLERLKSYENQLT